MIICILITHLVYLEFVEKNVFSSMHQMLTKDAKMKEIFI